MQQPGLSLTSAFADADAVKGPSSPAAVLSLVTGVAAGTVLPLIGGIIAMARGTRRVEKSGSRDSRVPAWRARD